MSWRGRGRGRGGRGFGGGRAAGEVKAGTYDLYPKLPALPEKREVLLEEEWVLIKKRRLESCWRHSPYFLEKPATISRNRDHTGDFTARSAIKLDRGSSHRHSSTPRASLAIILLASNAGQGGKVAEIERYSDKTNPKIRAKCYPLSTYLTPSYFPEELVKGSRRGQQSKEQYSRQPDLLKLDKYEKLEGMLKSGGQEDKDENKKKEDEDEEAGEEELELEEELIGEDDYNQIYGFDDDDDYLEVDGGEDEGPVYD